MDNVINAVLSQNWKLALAAGGVVLLLLAWFAVRWWIAVTRPPRIRDIPTPRLDRLNEEALGMMNDPRASGRPTPDEPSPADLLAAVKAAAEKPPDAARRADRHE